MNVKRIHKAFLMLTMLLASFFCISCSYHGEKSIESTMKRMLFMLPSYLEGPEGMFPYNTKGYAYALYDLGISKVNPGQELYVEQPTKGYRAPFAYDHKNHRVTDSLVHYINAPNLFFETDPDKAVMVLAAEEAGRPNRIFFISNDLCLYTFSNSDPNFTGEESDFLGMHLRALEERGSLTLIKDEKQVMLDLISNDRCTDWYAPWFCDVVEQWLPIWQGRWGTE